MEKDICLCCLEDEVEAYEVGIKRAIHKGLHAPMRQWVSCPNHEGKRQSGAWNRLYERIAPRLAFPIKPRVTSEHS